MFLWKHQQPKLLVYVADTPNGFNLALNYKLAITLSLTQRIVVAVN